MGGPLESAVASVCALFEDDEALAKKQMVGLVLGFRPKLSPGDLLDELQRVFDAPTSSEASRQAVRKICSLHVEHAGCDFVRDEALRQRMFQMLEQLVSETHILILNSMVDQDAKRMAVFASYKQALVFTEDRTKVQRFCAEMMSSCTPKMLANAIRDVDRELLSCLNASNINSPVFSVHFNSLAFSVVSFVLSVATHDQQIAVMKLMVEVAAKLYDMHDYNGLYAVISGLCSHNIERIPTLGLGSLPASHRLTLQQLKGFCSPDDNYLGLRTAQSADLAETVDVVPFFPTYFRDIVSVQETSTDLIKVGLEVARLMEFKENIITIDLSRPPSVGESDPSETPETRAQLRQMVFDLPVLSEEGRDLCSDIWKQTVVRNGGSRSGKRSGSSQVLGKSMLADKGKRIYGTAPSGPLFSPPQPKKPIHTSDPGNDHLVMGILAASPRSRSSSGNSSRLQRRSLLLNSSPGDSSGNGSPRAGLTTSSSSNSSPKGMHPSPPPVPMAVSPPKRSASFLFGSPSRSVSDMRLAQSSEGDDDEVKKSVSVGDFAAQPFPGVPLQDVSAMNRASPPRSPASEPFPGIPLQEPGRKSSCVIC